MQSNHAFSNNLRVTSLPELRTYNCQTVRGDRATEAEGRESGATGSPPSCLQSRRVSWVTYSLVPKGASDECANLQQTFCREFLATDCSIGRLDRRADCCCIKVRLVNGRLRLPLPSDGPKSSGPRC